MRFADSLLFFQNQNNNQPIISLVRQDSSANELPLFSRMIEDNSRFFQAINDENDQRLFCESFYDGFLASVPTNIHFFKIINGYPVQLNGEEIIRTISLLLTSGVIGEIHLIPR